MKRLCKICNILIAIAIMTSLFSCSKSDTKSKVNFIVDEKGNKMYKNEDGIYVRNDWYEINGDKYYFDGNGYLLTNQWINDEYLVDENGKLITNFWYEEKGKTYYLGPDGKYYKGDIFEIDGKEYNFDDAGVLIKGTVYVDKNDENRTTLIDQRGIIIRKEGLYELPVGKFYVDKDGYVIVNGWKNIDGTDRYFGELGMLVDHGFALAKDVKKSTDSEAQKWCYIKDESGKSTIVKNDWVKDAGKWYYAGDDGVLLCNEWEKIDGEEYYFKDQCDMAVNEFVDGTYYVDENGKKVKNVEKSIEGVSYTFDANGKANKKIVSKTENSNWKLYTYTNTGNKYITGKYYYETTFLNSEKTTSYSTNRYIASFNVDKNDIIVNLKYRSTKADMKLYSDDVFITIKVNNNTLVSSQRVKRIDNEDLVLTKLQKDTLLNSLLVDNNKIEISIVDSWGGSIGMDYYSFEFYSTGFNEIYPNL